MRPRFHRPASGDMSRRINGAIHSLQDRQRAARRGADEATYDMVGAMLRGKATAYGEAIDILRSLERGYNLPRRLRWTDRRGSSS